MQRESKKAVVVPHVFRGYQFYSHEENLACHFKQAELKGVEAEFPMDKYIAAACPKNCDCLHIREFLINAKKEEKLPEAFADKSLCVHNRQPSNSRSTAHFLKPFSRAKAKVCEVVCGHTCGK